MSKKALYTYYLVMLLLLCTWTAAFFLLPTYCIITGIGYYNGFMLGTYDGYGFHSDYVAFFVDYGIIGTLLLITLFAYPLYLSGKTRITEVSYMQ